MAVRTVRYLAWLIHPRWRDEIVGDLLEESTRRRRAGAGFFRSEVRFAVDVVMAGAASRWQATRTDVSSDNTDAFGDSTDAFRTGRGWEMTELEQDLRFAIRGLLRAPLFTGVALLTLGAGIGLTLAIFTVVQAVLLRPLDYPEPDRLVLLQGQPGARFGVSMPQHLVFRDDLTLLDGASAWQGWAPVLEDANGVPSRLAGASVSANFFSVIGVRAAAGRLFMEQDGMPSHEPVVVVSHDFWTGRFGSDPSLIGRALDLGDGSYRVVGVAPAGFEDPVGKGIGFAPRQLWRSEPPRFRESEDESGNISFWSMGRLRPGATTEATTAEMRRLLVERYPDQDVQQWAIQFRAISVKDAVVEEVRPTLIILLATAGFVLLIACANLANLLLSRATVRRTELAVRSSLGAGRSRLVRQLLTESVVLGLAGSALGAVLAYATVPLLVTLAGPTLPRSAEVGFGGSVALAGLATGIGTALLFGMLPAFRATRQGALARSGGGLRGSASGGGRLRKGLVVAETALAMVLLTGAGLLTVTLLRLEAVDTGFETDGVWTLNVGLGAERFPQPELQSAALRRVEDALTALPGVTAVGSITDAPLSGAVNSTRIHRTDDTDETAAERDNVLVRAVTPGYFAAVGIPPVRGQALSRELEGGEDVAVVNGELVRRFFPGEDPVGQPVVVRGVERTIIGVVPSVREFDLTSGTPDPVLYTPYAQERESWMRSGVTLTVRTDARDAELASRLRGAVLTAEPAVLAGAVRPMSRLVDAQLRAPRFRATLVLLFGGLAVFLASVGLGGVIAYGVSKRIPELGIRMALGARSADVRGMMLKETTSILLVGVALGTAGSLVSASVLSAFLFQVEPREPAVLVGSACLLVAVGLLAGWWPARRAAQIDPVSALRAS